MSAQGVVLSGAVSSGWLPRGTTRLAAVIGDPITHSLSPVLHNAAFRELGLDWVYVALTVGRGHGSAALRAASELGISGLSVTMPLKDEVAAASTPTAIVSRLGAANCLVADGSGWVAHNTDGAGFLADLQLRHGLNPAGVRAFVVGAGGASRAVIDALVGAGASVAVSARRSDAVAATVEMMRVEDEPAPSVRGEAHAAHPDELFEAELVVNATPLGMSETDAMPVDPDAISPGALVIDLIYHPLVTRWVQALRDRRIDAHHGLGMLVGQAAVQFTLWTGVDAPVDVMRSAAERALDLGR